MQWMMHSADDMDEEKRMDIEFAKSMSGHDRNQIYLVKEKDEKFVYLINGTTKTIDSPKKKSLNHVQLIKKLPVEVLDCIALGMTDINVKRAIKQYRIIKQEDL